MILIRIINHSPSKYHNAMSTHKYDFVSWLLTFIDNFFSIELRCVAFDDSFGHNSTGMLLVIERIRISLSLETKLTIFPWLK